ncbi:MAG: GTP-binding protein EngB [Bacteroidota bacterium]
MIPEYKISKAIKAIQDLIIKSRWLAYEDIPRKELGDFLDDVEYLPTLILKEEEAELDFELYLKMICEKHQVMYIYDKYVS